MGNVASVKYTDSRGNEFDLMVDSIRRIKDANFHDYEWTTDTSETRFGEKLRAWSKDAAVYNVAILFESSDRARLLNEFHDALEYDIFNFTPGTLSWEEYYIKCYGKSSKTYPESTSTINEVTFYCPSPWWNRDINFSSYDTQMLENTLVYTRTASTPFSKYWLSKTPNGEPLIPLEGIVYQVASTGDYYEHIYQWNGEEYVDLAPDWIKNYHESYPYPYDYMADYNAFVGITNTNILGSSYILTIYGPCSDPYVIISPRDPMEDDVAVQINTDVKEGETLVIDSTEKTVYKYLVDGSTVNCFGSRNINAGYLWNKVAAGKNNITWNGAFKFDLKLIEERSEPKWLLD